MRLRHYNNGHLMDIPYELSTITVTGLFEILVYVVGGGEEFWIVEKYDSLEKVNEVMRLLLKAYDAGESAFVFPKNDEVKI